MKANLPDQLLAESNQWPYQNKPWPQPYQESKRRKKYLHSPYTKEHHASSDQSLTPHQISTLHLHNHQLQTHQTTEFKNLH